MTDQIEINYRTKAQLTLSTENGSSKLLVRVIYEELYQFFQNEKQITGEYLRKPFIAQQNQLYIFPSPKGVTLEEMLRQKFRFAIEDISHIFNQLLLAVFQLHQQKHLGRCFNIGNIYYYEQSIILSAFGFYSDLQMIPPEFMKHNTYGLSIDIWLIGLVMYQLLTGNIIESFSSAEEYTAFYAKIDKKSIDKQFCVLLMKMLHPQESKRLTFGSLHSIHKCALQNQHIRDFYKDKVDIKEIMIAIETRERFNAEWAVPKEFNEKQSILFFNNQHQKKKEQPSSELVINYQPDPTFMQLYCRSKEEKLNYPDCWNEIHFQLYRFYIMDSQIQCLRILTQVPYLIWVRYCILKMLIIIKKEFMNNIHSRRNFLNVPQKQWEMFLQNSKELKQILSNLQNQIANDHNQLKYFLKETQDQTMFIHSEEKRLLNQLTEDGAFIQNDQYDKFEEYKVPYRRCLQFGYYELEKIITHESGTEDLKYFVRLRLQTIICMAINRVFDKEDQDSQKQNREINFRILKQHMSLDLLTTPCQVQDFLLKASVKELQSLTEEIHKLFFPRKSIITTPSFK